MSSNSAGSKRNGSNDGGDDEPAKKKIKSYDVEVIVRVGKGENMKEFTADGYCLARASPNYFDTMLSSNMKEGTTKTISFPEMDPKEWEEIYKFIDFDTKDIAKVTKDNIYTLLPWFHLFQMGKHVKQCDETLYWMAPLVVGYQSCLYKRTSSSYDCRHKLDFKGQIEVKEELLGTLYDTAAMYELHKTIGRIDSSVKALFSYGGYLFSIEDIAKMLTATDIGNFMGVWVKIILDGFGCGPDGIATSSTLSNPLLPKLIFDHMQKKHELEEANSKLEKANSKLEDAYKEVICMKNHLHALH